MAKDKEKKKEKEKVYNSQKIYQWRPDDDFTISGEELSLFYNVFNALANQSGYQLPPSLSPAIIVSAFNKVSSLIERGVEDGVISEKKD